MVKNLFAEELAERLNVSRATLHKKEFQRRLNLPLGKMGKRLFIPEDRFEQWVLERCHG